MGPLASKDFHKTFVTLAALGESVKFHPEVPFLRMFLQTWICIVHCFSFLECLIHYRQESSTQIPAPSSKEARDLTV